MGTRRDRVGGVLEAVVAPEQLIAHAYRRHAAHAAGGRDNGAPGPREIYHPTYYGAFVLDPDGNNIEAVFHGELG